MPRAVEVARCEMARREADRGGRAPRGQTPRVISEREPAHVALVTRAPEEDVGNVLVADGARKPTDDGGCLPVAVVVPRPTARTLECSRPAGTVNRTPMRGRSRRSGPTRTSFSITRSSSTSRVRLTVQRVVPASPPGDSMHYLDAIPPGRCSSVCAPGGRAEREPASSTPDSRSGSNRRPSLSVGARQSWSRGRRGGRGGRSGSALSAGHACA